MAAAHASVRSVVLRGDSRSSRIVQAAGIHNKIIRQSDVQTFFLILSVNRRRAHQSQWLPCIPPFTRSHSSGVPMRIESAGDRIWLSGTQWRGGFSLTYA